MMLESEMKAIVAKWRMMSEHKYESLRLRLFAASADAKFSHIDNRLTPILHCLSDAELAALDKRLTELDKKYVTSMNSLIKKGASSPVPVSPAGPTPRPALQKQIPVPAALPPQASLKRSLEADLMPVLDESGEPDSLAAFVAAVADDEDEPPAKKQKTTLK